jgi:hypothetical protein
MDVLLRVLIHTPKRFWRTCCCEGAASGGVAQLGERLLCKQEAIGSIPFTSTTIVVGYGGKANGLGSSRLLQDGLGVWIDRSVVRWVGGVRFARCLEQRSVHALYTVFFNN